jgi:HPt (histidine-containing phosphotransfer) domain-containing protein
MLTLDNLRKLGADVESGLVRCVNNEDFYLKMVRMALEDNGYELLKQYLEDGNLDAAFDRAHSLKGVLGNVGLTKLFKPITELTEELRPRSDFDYTGYIEILDAEYEKHRALL